MGASLIDIRGVTKTYLSGSVETRVLHGIDLQVARGDFVSVMGQSGSGQSSQNTPTISGIATMRAQVRSVGRLKNIRALWRKPGSPTDRRSHSSSVRGLKRRASSKRNVSVNFHGLGRRETSP